MKKITILIILVFLLYAECAKAQNFTGDTLQFLHAAITNKKHLIVGKPLKTVFNILNNNKLKIVEYTGPFDKWSGSLYINDTTWISEFSLYFNDVVDTKEQYHNNTPFDWTFKTKSHFFGFKAIKIYLNKPIYFLEKWFDMDRQGIASITWNLKVEMFYRNCIVKDIVVYEF